MRRSRSSVLKQTVPGACGSNKKCLTADGGKVHKMSNQ